MTQPVRYRVAPEFWDDKRLPGRVNEHLRKLGQLVNLLFKGRSNSIFNLTLAANATETVLETADATAQTQAYFTPKTASAANSIAKLYFTAANGKITVHHDASPATDRTYGVALLG